MQRVPVANRFIARLRFTGLRTPSDSLRDAHYRSRKHTPPQISVGRTCTCTGYPGWPMRTRCCPLFSPPPLERPVRLAVLPDSVGKSNGLPGRLHAAWIAGKHPSVIDRQSCRANPLGHPAGTHAGRTFCDPRTSCGRTIGRTIALLNRARVGRILGDNRSTRWLDLFPSAPFLASIPAERIAFRPVRIIAGVQMVIHLYSVTNVRR